MRLGLPQVVFLSLSLLRLTPAAVSQQVSPRPLITQPIVEGQLTTLKGNTHPLARPQYDIGAAPLNLPMQRMLLVLKRSPEQDFALKKLVDDQQDKASPNYHKWLTPDEFGAQFGPSDQDLQLVTGWLQTHGLQVNRVTHGRTVIEFSGTEAQVEEALHTQIHKYVVNGEEHWANASDPQIPAALAPAVAGVWTLHDFRKQLMSRLSRTQYPAPVRVGSPLATSSSGHHFLMPADYATIYNINSLYSSGVQGQGAKIAVVARSGLTWYDVYSFHNIAGIPTNVNVIDDGPDPGIFSQGEEAEAVLDATWSSAIAYNALTNVVISASTNTTDGVDLSELYIIDNNIGDVMTESFGACEAFFTSSEAAGFSSLAEQAAAEGITYMVSAGDSGAEGCDNPNSLSASGPVSANMLASSPFNVSIGGTVFNETGNNAKYWNSTNNQSNLSSVKSYIPENVWNESCAAGCGLWAGGGGVSTFFAKPTWQSGVQGIPSDGVRDQPDVSLSAAGHDPYLICFEGSCQQGFLAGIAGTSASAPSFTGIMALVVQQYGRQGQANYTLYRLAATQTLSQCNASNTSTLPASTCIFNDVTSGNNAVPGEAGYGTGSAQYKAGTGYDLSTGLGSVNVANLVNKWNTVTFNATTTTLSPSSVTGVHGSPITLNASVAPNSGSGVPSGDVSLVTGSNQGIGFLTLVNGAVSSQVNNLPGGVYTMTAHYGGDATFAPSPPSNSINVNITPEGSKTTLSLLTFGQSGNPVPFTSGPYGGFVYIRSDVQGQSGHGTATGSVSFQDNNNFNLGPLLLNSKGQSATPNGYFAFGVGQHSLVAQYQGDASFNTSASSAAGFSITRASTNSLLAVSAPVIVQGSSATVTATVSSPAFAGFYGTTSPLYGESTNAPGGTVTFFAGNTQLGTAQASGGQLTPNGFSSSFYLDTSTFSPGQYTITAQYSGDSNYLSSSASSVNFAVDADFGIAAGSTSVSAKAGASGTNTLTITGLTGYSNTINFTSASCTGLPVLTTCSFSPSTVNGSGSSTVTIKTTAPTAAGLRGWGWTSTGFVFAGVFLLGAPLRRLRTRRGRLSLLLGLTLASASCGGGGGGGGGGGNPGTPHGSYTVTVTATTGDRVITHTTAFTLVVQ